MAKHLGIQMIGLAGTALFFLSYQCRSNRKLFRVQLLSYLCYTAHLLLLGGNLCIRYPGMPGRCSSSTTL